MIDSASKYGSRVFLYMPRGHLTKDIIKCEILKIKSQLESEGWTSDPKGLAHKYLNILLDKIEEYSR